MRHNLQVGQSWSYETMPGFESSRIIIGSIEEYAEVGEVICITLTNAPLPTSGSTTLDKATIPFIPFARDSIDECVKKLDGDFELAENFSDLHADWMSDTDGEDFLPVTVPIFLEMLASASKA